MMASKDTKEPALNIGEALSKAGLTEAASSEEQVATLTPAQTLELLKRLDSLEKALVEQKAETERVIAENANASGKRYSPGEKAFAGVEGYQFKVTPIPKKDGDQFPHLKPQVVEACDESEALRWYCVANESRPGSGQALDPMKIRLKVESVGRKRADSIVRQKQIGALRLKVNAGLQLSEKEADLLETCEKEIFNF
jgi:hypothetical protein